MKKLKYELFRGRLFKKKHGYPLNISSPTTFNEKIYYRKYYGNHEEMALIADKYKVRELVSKRIGAEYLIPLLGVYDKFSISDWDDLPEQFVLKTNHGSGFNHIQIVTNKQKENPYAIIEKMNKALKDDFGSISHEPFYEKIDRVILAEKYLDSGLMVPDDFKFHCFEDEMFIQIDRGRYGSHSRSIYDHNWNEMDYKLNSSYPKINGIMPPINLSKMIELAKCLADNFDYIRVDFYNLDGKIYFGELTQTHGNGLEDFKPTLVDREWGDYWKLDKDNK
ncbi:hypothetical protein L4C33_22455, partial [Vibrio makurazakiensis]|uniref:ATP-grasp fold amidoligase family protein n=1 Tax=Vibrio makurazakiensis TaxID=2910250 RepID=UPI003D14D708